MGGLGQAAGHQGGHGPQDHGFVAGGQVFVVADGASVLADPGEGPLDDPAAGQDLEGVRVAFGDDLDSHLQGGRPAGELAVRSTYKIASTIRRTGQTRGLPRRPGMSAGKCGAMTSHWASVRSLG
jgi:hypothetical protein